jgi:hypothetical protein
VSRAYRREQLTVPHGSDGGLDRDAQLMDAKTGREEEQYG